MALLTREQILDAQDLKWEEVSVPEWGGEILIWELTGAERSEYETSIMRRNGAELQMDLQDYQAKLLVMSIKDENGKRLFKDVAQLNKKAAAPLNRLFMIAQRLSAMSEQDVEKIMGKSETLLSADTT